MSELTALSPAIEKIVSDGEPTANELPISVTGPTSSVVDAAGSPADLEIPEGTIVDEEVITQAQYVSDLLGSLIELVVDVPRGKIRAKKPLVKLADAAAFRGKLASLHTLSRHPRASLPVNNAVLRVLKQYMQTCVNASKIEYNEDDNMNLQMTCKNMDKMENLIVRAIIRGDDFCALLDDWVDHEFVEETEEMDGEDVENGGIGGIGGIGDGGRIEASENTGHAAPYLLPAGVSSL